MAFWKKQASVDGWISVVFNTDRIGVADIARHSGERPVVRACESFAREGSELDALKRLKGAKRLERRCTSLLGHGQYQLLQVDAPDNATTLPREELRESLRWRVKEMVDFPVDQAGIDVLDIPVPGGRTPQLFVVLAGREAQQARVRLFQDAKAPLAAIDIPELAQRNLAALFEEANRGLALVSFDTCDKAGGLLTVSYQGELIMTRHLDVSGPELASANAEGLHERVLLDIQRSLDNFDRNYSSITLNRLLIGPLPGGDAFASYLGTNLSLPVSRANLGEVLDLSAVPRLAELQVQAESWFALGAALREA
jgi:MSHA biogenesis protein MshI